jgi:hypothetical protein
VTGHPCGKSGLSFCGLVIGKECEGQQPLGLLSGMQLTSDTGKAHGFSGSVARP